MTTFAQGGYCCHQDVENCKKTPEYSLSSHMNTNLTICHCDYKAHSGYRIWAHSTVIFIPTAQPKSPTRPNFPNCEACSFSKGHFWSSISHYLDETSLVNDKWPYSLNSVELSNPSLLPSHISNCSRNHPASPKSELFFPEGTFTSSDSASKIKW